MDGETRTWKYVRLGLLLINIVFNFATLVTNIYLIAVDNNNSHELWLVFALFTNVLNIVLLTHTLLQKIFKMFKLSNIFNIKNTQLKLMKFSSYFAAHCFEWGLIIIFLTNLDGINKDVGPLYSIILARQIWSVSIIWFFILLLTIELITILILYCVRKNHSQQGATPEMISQYSTVKTFKEWAGIEDEYCESMCPICNDEYKNTDKIAKLTCKHYYHDNCITQWLEQSDICPICRQKINKAEDMRQVNNEA